MFSKIMFIFSCFPNNIEKWYWLLCNVVDHMKHWKTFRNSQEVLTTQRDSLKVHRWWNRPVHSRKEEKKKKHWQLWRKNLGQNFLKELRHNTIWFDMIQYDAVHCNTMRDHAIQWHNRTFNVLSALFSIAILHAKRP